MKALILALLIIGSVLAQAGPLTLFDDIIRAQNQQHYPTFLKNISEDLDTETLAQAVTKELNAIKTLSRQKRNEELRQVFYYYSESAKGFKPTALNLIEAIPYTFEDLVSNKYDSATLAKILVDTVRRYETKIMTPLYAQIVTELTEEDDNSIFIFLGRDFTPIYLYAEGRLKGQRLNLNASRATKDALFQSAEQRSLLRSYFRSLGITEADLSRKTFYFLDSSSKGKIPAAVLYSLVENLDDATRYKVLTNARIRYVTSRQRGTQELHKAISSLAPKKTLSQSQTHDILAGIDSGKFAIHIPQFDLSSDFDAGDFRMHNFFEHRFKTANSNSVLAKVEHGVIVQSKPLTSPSERIAFLLGLAQETQIHMNLTPEEEVNESTSVETPKVKELLHSSTYSELKRAFRDGRKALTAWLTVKLSEKMIERFRELEVRETGEKDMPFEIFYKGEMIYRARSKIGEGNNVIAYLTESGTVVKVIKDPLDARKNLLGVYMQKRMADYGIPFAKILDIHPSGIYLEQEYVPGKNLEVLNVESKGQLAQKLNGEILDIWYRAYKLAEEENIWLDFKAANFQLDREGRPVMIDYVPRLNAGYFSYFTQMADGPPLNAIQFLERFFYYDIKKQAARAGSKVPPVPPATNPNVLLHGLTPPQRGQGVFSDSGNKIKHWFMQMSQATGSRSEDYLPAYFDIMAEAYASGLIDKRDTKHLFTYFLISADFTAPTIQNMVIKLSKSPGFFLDLVSENHDFYTDATAHRKNASQVAVGFRNLIALLKNNGISYSPTSPKLAPKVPSNCAFYFQKTST